MLNNDKKYKNPPPIFMINLQQKAKEAIHFDPDKKLPFK
jgi:hypothetical protein